MKFEDVVEIKSGSLLKRIKESDNGIDYFVYDQYMFKDDMGNYRESNITHKLIKIDENSSVTTVEEGDVILNLMTGKCVVTKKRNYKIVLPYNYAILIPKKILTSNYLAFWFNYSEEANQQISKLSQGSTKVKKLTLSKLKSFNIQRPDQKKQDIISKMYSKEIQLNKLRNEKRMLENKIKSNII